MAFPFPLIFFLLPVNGGYNRKRDDDGDDSPPFRRYTFRYRNNMLQVMRLMEVLFLGKNFVLFGLWGDNVISIMMFFYAELCLIYN